MFLERNLHVLLFTCFAFWLFAAPTQAYESLAEAMSDPTISEFVGKGFGQQHPSAPANTSQFGQLTGIWVAKQELLTPNGWKKEPDAYWTWKYVLGGYATSDLWYQPEESLAEYLGISGRPYMLTGLRVFDMKTDEWRVGWAANGGGESPGQDGGHFTAVMEDGELVMSGPPFVSPQGTALQRVVFYNITDSTFQWRSDFSTDDGASWNTVMKVSAHRLQ